jgi:hypothetical protein
MAHRPPVSPPPASCCACHATPRHPAPRPVQVVRQSGQLGELEEAAGVAAAERERAQALVAQLTAANESLALKSSAVSEADLEVRAQGREGRGGGGGAGGRQGCSWGAGHAGVSGPLSVRSIRCSIRGMRCWGWTQVPGGLWLWPVACGLWLCRRCRRRRRGALQPPSARPPL